MIRALSILCVCVFVSLNHVRSDAQEVKVSPAVQDVLSHVMSPEMQKELELTNEQLKALLLIKGRFVSLLTKYSALLQAAPDADPMKHHAHLQEQVAAFDKEALEILTPAQVKRLSQFVATQRYQADKVDRGLLSVTMAARLGISAEQTEQIKKKVAEIELPLNVRVKELEREIAGEKSKARDALLELLTEAQREEYKKLVPLDE